jgi:hypothetical protein
MDFVDDRKTPQRARTPSPRYQYAIRVEGLLDAHWSEWLEGMTITHESWGIARLEGPIVDQAALHSLLNKLWDLRLPLLTVHRLGEVGSDARSSEEPSDSAA